MENGYPVLGLFKTLDCIDTSRTGAKRYPGLHVPWHGMLVIRTLCMRGELLLAGSVNLIKSGFKGLDTKQGIRQTASITLVRRIYFAGRALTQAGEGDVEVRDVIQLFNDSSAYCTDIRVYRRTPYPNKHHVHASLKTSPNDPRLKHMVDIVSQSSSC